MPSVTMLVPWESASTTLIWGCISVGKPGYGWVFTCVRFRRLVATTRTESSDSSIWHPISTSFALIASRCFGITFLTTTSPLVAAAPIMKVPASIMSGTIA